MADLGVADPEVVPVLVLDQVAVREHLALTAIRELVAAAHGDEMVTPLEMTAGMLRMPQGGPELNRRANDVGNAAKLIGGISFLLAGLAAVEEA